eukprot:1160563-Pelagomonas_calceolata.AAC.2
MPSVGHLNASLRCRSTWICKAALTGKNLIKTFFRRVGGRAYRAHSNKGTADGNCQHKKQLAHSRSEEAVECVCASVKACRAHDWHRKTAVQFVHPREYSLACIKEVQRSQHCYVPSP